MVHADDYKDNRKSEAREEKKKSRGREQEKKKGKKNLLHGTWSLERQIKLNTHIVNRKAGRIFALLHHIDAELRNSLQ